MPIFKLAAAGPGLFRPPALPHAPALALGVALVALAMVLLIASAGRRRGVARSVHHDPRALLA